MRKEYVRLTQTGFILAILLSTRAPHLVGQQIPLGRNDQSFEAALLHHAMNDAALSRVVTLLDRLGRAEVPRGRTWSGVNPHQRPARSIVMYVVNAKSLVRDPRTCGYQLERSDAYDCYRASALANNCAAVTSEVMACDAELVLRLSHWAIAVVLEHAIDPASIRPGSLPVLARVFLSLRGTSSINDRLELLAAANQQIETGRFAPLAEDRDSVLVGFLKFFVLHELGHIVLGHVTNNALPACALALSTNSLSDEFLAQERAADNFALERMSQLIRATLTSDYAAPLVFQVLATEQVYEAASAAGVNIATPAEQWNTNQKEAIVTEYLRRTCSGTHPYLNRRFLTFVQSRRYRGVNYPDVPGVQREVQGHDAICRRLAP
jgi:hypothetical protein